MRPSVLRFVAQIRVLVVVVEKGEVGAFADDEFVALVVDYRPEARIVAFVDGEIGKAKIDGEIRFDVELRAVERVVVTACADVQRPFAQSFFVRAIRRRVAARRRKNGEDDERCEHCFRKKSRASPSHG